MTKDVFVNDFDTFLRKIADIDINTEEGREMFIKTYNLIQSETETKGIFCSPISLQDYNSVEDNKIFVLQKLFQESCSLHFCMVDDLHRSVALASTKVICATTFSSSHYPRTSKQIIVGTVLKDE